MILNWFDWLVLYTITLWRHQIRMYFLFSVMVCGYKWSCLKNLAAVMSGCRLLDPFPLYQFLHFKMARKNLRGQEWGRRGWKGDVIVGADQPPKVSACCLFQTGSFRHRCLVCLFFLSQTGNICSWKRGTSVGQQRRQYWIAVNLNLMVPQFDLIKQACLPGEYMSIRRKLKAVDESF